MPDIRFSGQPEPRKSRSGISRGMQRNAAALVLVLSLSIVFFPFYILVLCPVFLHFGAASLFPVFLLFCFVRFDARKSIEISYFSILSHYLTGFHVNIVLHDVIFG